MGHIITGLSCWIHLGELIGEAGVSANDDRNNIEVVDKTIH
jgi:hypothetical protein